MKNSKPFLSTWLLWHVRAKLQLPKNFSMNPWLGSTKQENLRTLHDGVHGLQHNSAYWSLPQTWKKLSSREEMELARLLCWMRSPKKPPRIIPNWMLSLPFLVEKKMPCLQYALQWLSFSGKNLLSTSAQVLLFQKVYWLLDEWKLILHYIEWFWI